MYGIALVCSLTITRSSRVRHKGDKRLCALAKFPISSISCLPQILYIEFFSPLDLNQTGVVFIPRGGFAYGSDWIAITSSLAIGLDFAMPLNIDMTGTISCSMFCYPMN